MLFRSGCKAEGAHSWLWVTARQQTGSTWCTHCPPNRFQLSLKNLGDLATRDAHSCRKVAWWRRKQSLSPQVRDAHKACPAHAVTAPPPSRGPLHSFRGLACHLQTGALCWGRCAPPPHRQVEMCGDRSDCHRRMSGVKTRTAPRTKDCPVPSVDGGEARSRGQSPVREP